MATVDAQGSTFRIHNGTSLIPVDPVKSFSGLDGEVAERDVTHLKSTAREFKLGLRETGNFNIELDLDTDDPGQTVLRAAYNDGQPREAQLELVNGYTIDFTVLVKSFPLNGGVDEDVTVSVSMRITGPATWTPPPVGP